MHDLIQTGQNLILIHEMKTSSGILSIIVIFVVVAGIVCTSCNVSDRGETLSPELERLMTRLDSMLERSSEYTEQKERRIAKLRSSFENTGSLERRYWIASDIYDEYRAYDSDSAHVWIERCIDIARKIGRNDLVRDMELNGIYIYSATGMLEDAAVRIRAFNLDSATDVQLLKLCERMIFLGNHRKQYIGEYRNYKERFVLKADSLLDVMIPKMKPDNPDYCWMLGWYSDRSIEMAKEVFPQIDSIVAAENEDNPSYAKDTWMLARLYRRLGNEEGRIKYLALSAMADVKNSNKEIASLEELGKVMLENGNLERANRYINRCIECANDYGSRVRLAALAKAQDQTLSEIHRRLEQQSRTNRVFIAVLGILIVILCLCVVYIIRRNRLLSRSRAEVTKANRELNNQVEELKLMHEQLNASKAELTAAYDKLRVTAKELSDVNDAKEEYIANIFGLCSNYITKLEDFRSRILSLLKERKFEDAMRIIRSPELSYDEVKELYANFDKVFLQIYADFVDDFNTLLRPEERIELKNPGQLTTELRIYALVRLGLNDSMKIARFLHCSVQTVYNARQRTRNKAIVAKEEFAARVQALGKPSF